MEHTLKDLSAVSPRFVFEGSFLGGTTAKVLIQLEVCFLNIYCRDFTLLLTHVLQDNEPHQA